MYKKIVNVARVTTTTGALTLIADPVMVWKALINGVPTLTWWDPNRDNYTVRAHRQVEIKKLFHRGWPPCVDWTCGFPSTMPPHKHNYVSINSNYTSIQSNKTA